MRLAQQATTPARKLFGNVTKALIPALLGVLAVTAVPSSAQAQDLFSFRAKLGVQFPSDSDVRNHVDTPLFAAELDYDLPSLTAGKTRISLGYIERRSSGNGFRAIPLTVSRIFSPPNPAADITGSVYFGAGGGLYFLRRTGGGSDEQTTVGIFAVAGYDFPRTLGFIDFVEAKYHLVSGGANGLSPNGLVLMLGKRF
ncbi:MAG: hypothetical protein OHK0029_12860 [Armatimonadaceae bacterium]